MKSTRLTIALAAAAAAAFAGSALAADGTITFNGRVTDQTCTINGGTGQNFAVTLPTVSRDTLAAAGEVAGRTPFSIQLTNCTAGSSVATYFEPGATVDFTTGRLINQAAAGATNVQLQLLGNNNQFLPILAASGNGAQTNSQWVAVDGAGAADLDYYVEYYATGASTAGDVTSTVQYTIIYQ